VSAAVVAAAAPGGPRRTPSVGVRARAAAVAGGSAPLLVVALAVSMHLGSAIATGLFGRVDPVGSCGCGAPWRRCCCSPSSAAARSRCRARAAAASSPSASCSPP
jgi:hypothetical protein